MLQLNILPTPPSSVVKPCSISHETQLNIACMFFPWHLCTLKAYKQIYVVSGVGLKTTDCDQL